MRGIAKKDNFVEPKCFNVCLSVNIKSESKNNAKELLDDVCRALFVNYSITSDSNMFKVLVPITTEHDNDAYFRVNNMLNTALLDNLDSENYSIRLEYITEIKTIKEPTFYRVNFYVKYLSNEEFEDYVSTHENIQIYHNPSNKIFNYKSCSYSGNRPSTLTIRVTDENDKEICFDIKNCGIVIEDKRDKI